MKIFGTRPWGEDSPRTTTHVNKHTHEGKQKLDHGLGHPHFVPFQTCRWLAIPQVLFCVVPHLIFTIKKPTRLRVIEKLVFRGIVKPRRSFHCHPFPLVWQREYRRY